MANYFTSDHFKLLNRWKGQRRDESNPEQGRAYEDLKTAYEVTEAWADAVTDKLFPLGRVEVRKRPTSQGNTFLPYNWARIYPTVDAPKSLAYTVGINADQWFVVKIDTVGLDEGDAVRRAYLALRGGEDGASPIVARLPMADGLAMSLPELTEWSVTAIRGFKLRYDEVVAKLNLGVVLSDEDLLKHFDGKPAFKVFRASWSPQDKAIFCRLARAVHAAGLDWWHVDIGTQVRFGRKVPGGERATGVLGIVQGTRAFRVSMIRAVGDVLKMNREPLTEELLVKLEAALVAERDALEDWLPLDVERPGLWPDALRDDPADPGQELDDELAPTAPVVRPALNRIYYGPPGTGKTYTLTELLKREYEQPLASISDAEWRKQFIVENFASLKWWEVAAAALHELGGQAKVAQLVAHPFIQACLSANPLNKSPVQTLWGALQYHTVEESVTVKTKKGVAPAIFDKIADSTWKLAGNWQEECADLINMVATWKSGQRANGLVQRFSFVTFHQSYGYEEFVEGLRPLLDREIESGQVQYEIRPGVFKELCRKARQAPDQRYAMVIDEINRGNISKIFGELITLIEVDKREGAENAVSVILPYSCEPFSVPPNVDIIGTMNTADRSLALLDTALRRRFEFVPLMPDARDVDGAPLFGLRVTMGNQIIDIPRLLDAINQRVEALYDRDHCIGHAYFTHLKHMPDVEERTVGLKMVFANRILPLLEEYFFEDWQKIRLVLADNQKPKEGCFVVESQDPEGDLTRLFGGEHGLDSYAAKRRYVVQEAAYSNPDAYIGIYQTLLT